MDHQRAPVVGTLLANLCGAKWGSCLMARRFEVELETRLAPLKFSWEIDTYSFGMNSAFPIHVLKSFTIR